MSDEYKEIYAVEWRDGKPRSVEVLGSEGYLHTYDVDYCTRDNAFYFSNSGGHPIRDICEGLDKLPKTIKTWLDMIEHYCMNESSTVYCKICDDYFPETLNGDPWDAVVCDHISFDKDLCDWVGEGIP